MTNIPMESDTPGTNGNREHVEFWSIADFLPAMIMYKDTQNNILRLNRGAANLMGLPVTALEGNSVYDLNPAEAEAYYADDMEVITTGQPKIGIEEPLATATDGTRWLRTDKYPYRDDGGNVTGLIVFALDITQHKQTEDALQEATGKLATQAVALDRTTALLHASLQHISEMMGRDASREEMAAYIESIREESAQVASD